MKRALRKGTYADLNVYILPLIEYYYGRPLQEVYAGLAKFLKRLLSASPGFTIITWLMV
jgi:hypothetical protein